MPWYAMRTAGSRLETTIRKSGLAVWVDGSGLLVWVLGFRVPCLRVAFK